MEGLMLKQLLGITLTAVVLASATPIHAQIVNVQPLMSADSGEDAFKGEFGGSLTLKTGNVDLLLASSTLLASYTSGAHKIISSSSAQLGIKSGDEFLERMFTHLRYQIAFVDWLTWETYTQVATDRFRRMALRALVGTGPRIALVEGPAVAFAVAASYMFEREMLGESAFDDSGAAYNNHRLSLYVTGKFILAPLVSLIHTTYFQPRVDDPLDFRLSSETNLGFNLTSSVGLSVGVRVTYDAAPPEGVKDLDTSTNAKVTYAF